MSRDRKNQGGFNGNPFKSLKGLPVSGPRQVPAPAPASPPVSPEVTEDRDLFAREMAWLNVRPVADRAAGRSDKAAPPEATATESNEASEFLAALGKLDKTFCDELPPADDPPRARPRRMRQLERGEFTPSGELDLHGLKRDEALLHTRTFLGQASRQGWPAVVIVTGKGLHSIEGPVLRQAVERLLGESRELVLEWGEAPRRFGGAGALVVFMRGSGKREA
jgi:DNA-nicking Smr family endonuclease